MDGNTLLRDMVVVESSAPKNNKRMSTLLFWGRKGSNSPGGNGRNWIHQPDLLVKGHVAYLVKFLGSTHVDKPKGIEVVKDAIQKLNFNQQLKPKENAKSKKVEITISVDGVAIQVPRSSTILHQFPLHRISYCADDKGAKKYFSFIAKSAPATNGTNGVGNGTHEEQHECFVFVSTKLAAEITLTIGQAFDLAYRRFLNDNGKYLELSKLQLNNKRLELQVEAYRDRLLELSRLMYKDDVQGFLARKGLADVTEFKTPPELAHQIAALANAPAMPDPDTSDLGSSLCSPDANNSHNESNNLLLDTSPTHNSNHTSSSKNPVVGTKLEGLLLEDSDDSDFDPRASESEPPASRVLPRIPDTQRDNTPHTDTAPPPLIAPPPKTSRRQNLPAQAPAQNGSDLFGSTPFGLAPAPPANQFTNQMPAVFNHTAFSNNHMAPANTPFSTSNTPNYDISDFSVTSSVFNTSNTFTNGLAGYDPFDTRSNGVLNGGGLNGWGGLSEKQSVALDSSFNGFLDKRISEMKDGFSRGLSFGNDDFNIDHLDPLKKN